MDKFEELEKLAALTEKGILTPEEFEEQKKRFLTASVEQTVPSPRTRRNLPENIFLGVIWGILVLYILSLFGLFGEYIVDYRKIFFMTYGFLLMPDIVLFIVALNVRPFVIRARYFAYFFLLPIIVGMMGYVYDYMTADTYDEILLMSN